MSLVLGVSGASAVPIDAPLAPGDTVIVSCAGVFSVVPAANKLTIGCAASTTPTTTTGATAVAPTATAPVPPPSSGPVLGGGGVAGILISPAEVRALPMSGPGWEALKSAALGSWGSPNLSDLNAKHDVYTLAGALYYARTGDGAIRAKTAAAIVSAMGTESSSRALEISRNLVSYIQAADLIDLRGFDGAKEATFRAWLASVRTKPFSGMSIVKSSEKRPNNWGTHALATRIAIARYLGDKADLDRAAAVFKGWLGDRGSYAGYSYGDTSWQSNPSAPVGINPPGATIGGHNVDGVLPDDQRRAGGYTWPPPCENYVHEALQGALIAAVELHRAGFDVWNWQGKAILRAYTWLYGVDNCPASGDDGGYPWIVNDAYGTSFAGARPAPIGKNSGFQDWVFGG